MAWLSELIGFVLLAAAGLHGLGAWWRDRASPGSIYWCLAGLGIIYFAIDEGLNLHEHLGRLLSDLSVPNPPAVNHLDDAILASTALAGGLVTLAFLRAVLSAGRALAPFGAACVAAATALAIDAFAPTGGAVQSVEEGTEIAGQILFLVAFRFRFLDAYSPGSAPGWAEADRETAA